MRVAAAALGAGLCAAVAGSRSGGNYTVNDSIDGGGQRVSAAGYAVDGSLGGIGGIETDLVAATAVKAGYPGQLADLAGVAVTSTPVSVNEGGTCQLGAVAVMDDATLTPVASNEPLWLSVSPAVSGIGGSGVLTAAAVYTDTLARVDGAYMGMTGTTWVLVLDSNPDNYGLYANDGIPDAWQVQYFGLENPGAKPGVDADGTGQTNFFKYIAGLDPTNRASVFTLRIAPVAGYSNREDLVFSPRWPDRTYAVEFRSNVQSGAYALLPSASTNDSGIQRTITDLGANDRARYYRVRIGYP